MLDIILEMEQRTRLEDTSAGKTITAELRMREEKRRREEIEEEQIEEEEMRKEKEMKEEVVVRNEKLLTMSQREQQLGHHHQGPVVQRLTSGITARGPKHERVPAKKATGNGLERTYKDDDCSHMWTWSSLDSCGYS